jgi:hypothetical protein
VHVSPASRLSGQVRGWAVFAAVWFVWSDAAGGQQPSLLCTDAVCPVSVEWADDPPRLEFERALVARLDENGFPVVEDAETSNGLIRLLLDPAAARSQPCDPVPPGTGTAAARRCVTVEAVEVRIAPPGIAPYDGEFLRISGRCEDGGRMRMERMAEFVADRIASELRGGARPSSRC